MTTMRERLENAALMCVDKDIIEEKDMKFFYITNTNSIAFDNKFLEYMLDTMSDFEFRNADIIMIYDNIKSITIGIKTYYFLRGEQFNTFFDFRLRFNDIHIESINIES